MIEKYIQSNQSMWDEMALIHSKGSPTYPIEDFIAGKAGITPNIPDDIGDVHGKKMLHLQCHFGMDSLMWVRQGAQVTGVDFSSEAISQAHVLAEKTKLQARFIQSEVTELPDKLSESFNLVLNYCGVLCWLPDLSAWARTIAHFLKPGGFLYLADSHPCSHTLEPEGDTPTFVIKHGYWQDDVLMYDDEVGSYANPEADKKIQVSYEWQHPLSEIISALLDAGLRLDFFHEFPYNFWNSYFYIKNTYLHEDDKGWFHLSENVPKIPLMFSLKASKP